MCECKVGKLRYVRRMPQSIMVRRPRGQGGECNAVLPAAARRTTLPSHTPTALPRRSLTLVVRGRDLISGDLSDKIRSALTFDSTGAPIADDHFALLGNAQTSRTRVVYLFCGSVDLFSRNYFSSDCKFCKQ